MAYIPLFLSIHHNICDNALDMSRDKYRAGKWRRNRKWPTEGCGDEQYFHSRCLSDWLQVNSCLCAINGKKTLMFTPSQAWRGTESTRRRNVLALPDTWCSSWIEQQGTLVPRLERETRWPHWPIRSWVLPHVTWHASRLICTCHSSGIRLNDMTRNVTVFCGSYFWKRCPSISLNLWTNHGFWAELAPREGWVDMSPESRIDTHHGFWAFNYPPLGLV